MEKASAIASLALACLLLPQQGWTQQKKNLEKAAVLLERQSRIGKGEFIQFLTGAAIAYRWVGTNELGGAQPTYCPAAGLMLDGRSYAKIALEEYGRAKSEYASLHEYPLDVLTLALLKGLRGKFPCKPDDAASPTATSSSDAME